MDDCPFALNEFGIEQGTGEESRKPIQRTLQVIGIDIEIVVGVSVRGVCILGTTMPGDITLVFTRLGICLGAQKQHVLEEKYHVIDEDGSIREFVQNVGDTDHAALNDAINFARRVSSEVLDFCEDNESDVVWSGLDEDI